MDDVASLQVRDLCGEDLNRLTPGSPAARTRFLAEAAEILAAREEGDVLVIGPGDDVWAAAAAGYDRRFDEARIVTAREPRTDAALRRLLSDIEARTVQRHLPALVADVDVQDPAARRTFELLGYVVTGAGVAFWSEVTIVGPFERAADTWTVRKEVSAAPARRAPTRAAPRSVDDVVAD
jgi:hypothetical protein